MPRLQGQIIWLENFKASLGEILTYSGGHWVWLSNQWYTDKTERKKARCKEIWPNLFGLPGKKKLQVQRTLTESIRLASQKKSRGKVKWNTYLRYAFIQNLACLVTLPLDLFLLSSPLPSHSIRYFNIASSSVNFASIFINIALFPISQRALTVLSFQFDSNRFILLADWRKCAQREIINHCSLKHPNIVRFKEARNSVWGCAYFVLKHLMQLKECRFLQFGVCWDCVCVCRSY